MAEGEDAIDWLESRLTMAEIKEAAEKTARNRPQRYSVTAPQPMWVPVQPYKSPSKALNKALKKQRLAAKAAMTVMKPSDDLIDYLIARDAGRGKKPPEKDPWDD